MMADSVAMAARMDLAEAARPLAFVAIIGAFYRCIYVVMLSYSGIGIWVVVSRLTMGDCRLIGQISQSYMPFHVIWPALT
jgi:hypothetical protein